MLRISKLTDYGTVILAYLAAQPGSTHTASEVAERTHLGLATVSKLLKSLHRAGLVSSVRGSRGGYQLTRPAVAITAAAILDALEGPFALTECSGKHSACGIETTCRVGHAWQRINSAVHRALCDVSLAQLAGLDRGGTPPAELVVGLQPAGVRSPRAARTPGE